MAPHLLKQLRNWKELLSSGCAAGASIDAVSCRRLVATLIACEVELRGQPIGPVIDITDYSVVERPEAGR